MAERDPTSFDWTLLRSFLAVLDAGSLTGAARRTGLQQPTLSRHLAELEAQIGMPLFERTGRGVIPTPAALAIADGARRMQAGADEVARTLGARRAESSGTVRITTSEIAAAWLLPHVLAELAIREPGIQIELVASDDQQNLLRREADIAVRMARPAQGSLIARKLADLQVVAAAHADYLERAGTPVGTADLLRHRVIGHDRDDTILRGFAQAGIPVSREHFALRTDSRIAYCRLVATGAGIGFVMAYALVHWPGVVRVLPGLRIPALPCWLAVHREIRGSRTVRRVYDFLGESIPRHLATWEAAVVVAGKPASP